MLLYMEQGKPLLFGKNKEKGIKIDGVVPSVININENGNSINDVLIHDEFDISPVRSTILAHLTDSPDFPTPLGIFRQIFRPTVDGEIHRQVKEVKALKGEGDLEKMLFSGNTWEVN